jgi:putative ABC transport system permease protein
MTVATRAPLTAPRRRPSRAPRQPPPVQPSRLALRDLAGETLAGILQRPGRSLLTTVGTLLGVGTFVAVLGLTATASNQIGGRFDALAATAVTVEEASGRDPWVEPDPFPADADARIARLNGAVGGGVYWTVPLRNPMVRAAPVGADAAGQPLRVVAASPGLFRAVNPRLAAGRTFDAFHDARGEPVAVLGSAAARRLGIATIDTQPAIFIDDVPFSVMGVVADVQRQPDLLLDVIVPRGAAKLALGARPGADERPRMLIATRPGAAAQVAREAAVALRPADPTALKAVAPPDPRGLRDQVAGDLGTLFLLLAGICLAIGTVGIANTTLVAVMERIPEIGVRRALGARGRHVAGQFVAESGALGALGGLFGTTIGVVAVVSVAAAKQWTPVVEPLTVAAAPLIGVVTGLLAGAYPALRASRVEPVAALRR